MIFITKDDKVSKEKTREYLEVAGGRTKIDKQMIPVEEENAIVPNKPGAFERIKTFLYKGTGNPPGMENFVHEDGWPWYVPYRVEY